MRTVYYNLHNLIKIRISGLSRFALKDLNCKWHHFEVPSQVNSDIVVEIAPFEPNLEGATVIDQNYFCFPNKIYFTDSDKGLEWQTEISGIEEGPVQIRFWASPKNRMKLPWAFFPEMVLHLYVLQPLIEKILLSRGALLLHAGGVTKDGRATLFIGRGQTYKTTLTLRMLKQGFELLGDDFVLIKDKKVLSFPTSPRFLEFTRTQLKDERLNAWDNCRLASYLIRQKAHQLPIANSAELSQAFLLISQDTDSCRNILEKNRESFYDRILTNQLLESTSYVSYRYRIGQFLEAYDLAFPKAGKKPLEAELMNLIKASFQDAAIETLTIPSSFNKNIMPFIQSKVEALA
jgi:hypothetical protein